MRLLLRTSTKEPVVALDDVSLKVQPGELRAVLGRNGAGKSTLFRIITGLTTPTAGRATVMGLDTTSRSSAVRRMIGFMPAEHQTLLLRHSCRENMEFHGRLQGIRELDLKHRIDDTLDMVGLSEAKDRVGFALSSGMLARLMLARAILHRPSVLILDEPTGAVDPIGSYELLHTIQKIASESNIAVLISSHRLDEVELLNDQVLLLDRGKVVYSGGLAAMTTTARRPKVEIVLEHQNSVRMCADALAGNPDIDQVAVDNNVITITTELPVGTIMKRLDGHVGDIESIGRRPPRLGDVLAEMLHADTSQTGKA